MKGINIMKKKELERIMNILGYALVRQNKHDIWSNGKTTVVVPQHKELNYFTAKKVLRIALILDMIAKGILHKDGMRERQTLDCLQEAISKAEGKE
jgi:predicted RNA binding protein YcfA (HicA-like mRNA interferase family)